MVLSAAFRERIYQEVAEKVRGDARIGGTFPSARCLFWSMYGIESLRARGLYAILQAGSAVWRVVRPEDDDGKVNTHFGYMWSPNETPSQMAMAAGLMPEMHVWIGLPDCQELVDFCTGFWPEQARILGGYEWKADLPPKFFWGTADELSGARYTPEFEAVKTALMFVAREYGRDRAVKLVTK